MFLSDPEGQRVRWFWSKRVLLDPNVLSENHFW